MQEFLPRGREGFNNYINIMHKGVLSSMHTITSKLIHITCHTIKRFLASKHFRRPSCVGEVMKYDKLVMKISQWGVQGVGERERKGEAER